VDAGPWRTEMVSEAVAHQIGEWIQQNHPELWTSQGARQN
jgi:hypothetical protein